MLRMRKVSDRNRGRLEIIAEILRKLREPAGKTNIMSHCNMSSIQFGRCLNFMRSNNLIRIDTISGKVTYQRTEDGPKVSRTVTRWFCYLIPPFLQPP